MLLVGAAGKQEDFFEFENSYDLDEFMLTIYENCEGIEMVDFYRARDEFAKDHSIRQIFDM
ncbi:MAG: hypothetical protein ACR2LM_05810 [Pyrinomonadaceae bacterium]